MLGTSFVTVRCVGERQGHHKPIVPAAGAEHKCGMSWCMGEWLYGAVQSQQRFPWPAQDQRCLLLPAREMRKQPRALCFWIFYLLAPLCSREEPSQDFPLTAFLDEVSLMASGASRRYL